MSYVIGADVGSQSVKTVLLNDEGTVLANASARYGTSYPASGWAEQDPADWERALALSIRELRAEAGIGHTDVTMLALACQLDGLVPLGEDLRPLRPAIIWLDRRAARQSAALSEAAGEEVLIQRTGLTPDASHVAPKAMWLRDAEPARYRAARWLAPVGGHLNGWLTGEVRQDDANASSTLLYNVSTRDWCPELVEHAGLDLAQLVPIQPASERIGSLTGPAAEALGLSTRCQVAVGTGDDHASVLGAGALELGIVVDVTGTAEPVAVASTEVVLDERRLLETHAHAVPNMLLVENPGFVSGGSTRWWASTHGLSEAEMFKLAALAPPGSDGALFLPTLSGATAPRWNDKMRGAFAGLGLHHGREQLARAVLEGCSFALRDVVDRIAEIGLGGEELRVVGGGARSRLWLQIKADVTGRPVRAVNGESAASAGAAMLAGVAAGYFSDLHEAAACVVELEDEPVMPQAEVAERYEDAYGSYRRLFDGIEAARL